MIRLGNESDRRVVNAATMFGRDHRNSADIARALKISEPDALRLLDRARAEALLQ